MMDGRLDKSVFLWTTLSLFKVKWASGLSQQGYSISSRGSHVLSSNVSLEIDQWASGHFGRLTLRSARTSRPTCYINTPAILFMFPWKRSANRSNLSSSAARLLASKPEGLLASKEITILASRLNRPRWILIQFDQVAFISSRNERTNERASEWVSYVKITTIRRW